MKIMVLLCLVFVASGCTSSASETCKEQGGTWHKEFSHFFPLISMANKAPVIINIPQFKEWCANE